MGRQFQELAQARHLHKQSSANHYRRRNRYYHTLDKNY